MIYPKQNWLTDDARGIQMPWYTRPCLEVINDWDFNGKDIFEYGVGYSTIWYKSRGAICYGVDSDKKWADFAGASHHESKTNYLQAITYHECGFGGKVLDIVIIDGLFRDDCTGYALFMLKSGGKLILDNWLQPEVEEFWPKTQKLIEGMPIEVYKEPDHKYWQTAIVTV